MTELAPEVPPHLLWWLHDARWYQGVRKRYGQDVANEINAEAILFVARRAARRYAGLHGLDFPAMPMSELVKRFAELVRLLWTEQMTDVEHVDLGGGEFESVVRKHFALDMLRAARSLDGYECPCMQMRAGLFEGAGLDVADRRLECQRTGGDVCRFRAVVRRGDDAAPDEAAGARSGIRPQREQS